MARLEELQKEIESVKEEKERKETIANIPHKILFLVGFLFVAGYLYVMDHPEYKQQFVIAMIIGFLYLWNLGQMQKERILTWRECCFLLYQKLKEAQKYPIGDLPQIPHGAIKIELPNKRRDVLDYRGGPARPWKREIGFTIAEKDGLVNSWSAEIDLRTADIKSIVKRPEGFTGKEVQDIKVIYGSDLAYEKKVTEYRGE